MEISLFYITVENEAEATSLGNLAIEQHLAACSNIFPIQSSFPWDNQLQQEKEIVLILKTIPPLVDALRSFIQEKHTYDVPCIIHWTVEVNEEYGRWVEEIVSRKK